MCVCVCVCVCVRRSYHYQINRGNELSIPQNVCDAPPLLGNENAGGGGGGGGELKTQKNPAIFSLDYRKLCSLNIFS